VRAKNAHWPQKNIFRSSLTVSLKAYGIDALRSKSTNTEFPSGELPATGAKSVAERMRAYRRRRRSGVRCYEVQLGRAELNGLIAKGYLASDNRGDRQAIELAIDDLLYDFFRR
jgi:hypothetical protein